MACINRYKRVADEFLSKLREANQNGKDHDGISTDNLQHSKQPPREKEIHHQHNQHQSKPAHSDQNPPLRSQAQDARANHLGGRGDEGREHKQGNQPYIVRDERSAEPTVPTATISLDIDFYSIKDRRRFGEDVQSDIYFAAQLDPEDVRILDIRAGSTIVDFTVADKPGRRADAILQDLKQQLKEPNSRLRRGAVTRSALDMAVHLPQHQQKPVEKHPAGHDDGGFKFDRNLCRRIFDSLDRDGSGYLEVNELADLAERFWDANHPHGPKLSPERKKVGQGGHFRFLYTLADTKVLNDVNPKKPLIVDISKDFASYKLNGQLQGESELSAVPVRTKMSHSC